MEERQLIPLHVCDSMFALEKIADEPVADKDLDKCIEKLYNLTSDILQAYAAGDEEMEYISARKSLKLFKYIKQFKNFKTSAPLRFNESVVKPRFVTLQRSLTKRYLKASAEQHKLLLMTMKKPVPLDPEETTIEVDKVANVDPEFASFLKALADKNSKCLTAEVTEPDNTVYVDPFVLGLGRRKMQKPLYIAPSFHHLELISRNLKLPDLNFLQCIERMCLMLSLRRIVRTVDLELDFIILSRYLTLNAILRKMDDYHDKYDDYRSIIVKVVTIKNEYEEVKNLLIERYRILSTGNSLIKHLQQREELISAGIEEIRRRKNNWLTERVRAA